LGVLEQRAAEASYRMRWKNKLQNFWQEIHL